MNPFLRFMKKLSLLFGRRRFLSELEEEMAFHRGQGEGICSRRDDAAGRALRGHAAVRQCNEVEGAKPRSGRPLPIGHITGHADVISGNSDSRHSFCFCCICCFCAGHVGLFHQAIPACSRPFRLAMKSVPYGSIGVVKRCEVDPVPCSHGLHLFDPLLRDEASALGEGFKPARQSKSHAFQ